MTVTSSCSNHLSKRLYVLAKKVLQMTARVSLLSMIVWLAVTLRKNPRPSEANLILYSGLCKPEKLLILDNASFGSPTMKMKVLTWVKGEAFHIVAPQPNKTTAFVECHILLTNLANYSVIFIDQVFIDTAYLFRFPW